MRFVPAARRSRHPASAAFDDPTPRPPGVPTIADELPERGLNEIELDDEARIEHVALTGALPPGTVARGATIEEARIRGSLAGAKLHDFHLHDAQLTGADLANIDLQGAHLNRLEIANCRMTGAQLIETTLVDVTLAGCRLDFANLTLARLDRVVFRDCQLDEASFDQAQAFAAALGIQVVLDPDDDI
jgi:uncharacterized protein YjbI with pentapeptide repeats